MRLRPAVVALMAATTIAGGTVKGAPPVSIYVGPQTKDGFVSTENDVLASVRDVREALRKELGKEQGFRLVDEESAATVKLYLERSVGWSSGGSTVSVTGTKTGATGRVYESVSQYQSLTAQLRVGTHKLDFFAAVDGPKKLAKRIAKDVAVWLAANHERILSKSLGRPE